LFDAGAFQPALLIEPVHLQAWAKEREAVVCRRPSATAAFVHGLRVLWDMQRTANIHAINVSVRPASTYQSHKALSSSLDAQVARGATYLKRTREVHCSVLLV
jgi:hypothetical protein